MSNFSLLTLEQVNGSKALRCFKTYGNSCLGTDFVNLIGGYMSDQGAFYWLSDKKIGTGPLNVHYVEDIGIKGVLKSAKCDLSAFCIRPVISLKNINPDSIFIDSNDTMEIEYGEFPQTVERNDKAKMLESLYQIGCLTKTGKLYTINDPSKNTNLDNKPFIPKSLYEYELSDTKYVRIESNSLGIASLSDGTIPGSRSIYWVKVEPIRWIVDKFSNICVTKKAIMGGIPFNHSAKFTGYFNDSDIEKYFDFYFADEMKKPQPKAKKEKKSKVTGKANTVPYGFAYTNVTEEEMIKGAILSDVSVFLHGKSSDGKSARVKVLDPDCEIIYLRNATPESLNGKSAYNSNTGEMIDIPPTWYKRIMEKCEKHPDRIHIVFLDEITNALHSIQGMAFNIVLNKEVNGIWKLPENVRIVAAGNDLEDSMAANTLVEPLFNRFAHVYINTTAKSWLKWAMDSSEEEYLPYTKQKKNPRIHPAVYAYIMARGDSALRTPYNGQKPNADPRKWELASKVLYTTGKPMMIKSLVGSEIAKDFCNFCKQNKLSIADVVEGKYNIDEIKKYDISQKYLIIVALVLCEEAHFYIVREFVKKLEPELLSLFDSLWLQNNPDRSDMISVAVNGD